MDSIRNLTLARELLVSAQNALKPMESTVRTVVTPRPLWLADRVTQPFRLARADEFRGHWDPPILHEAGVAFNILGDRARLVNQQIDLQIEKAVLQGVAEGSAQRVADLQRQVASVVDDLPPAPAELYVPPPPSTSGIAEVVANTATSELPAVRAGVTDLLA